MAHVRSARPASERRPGWTLIELLIVIMIITILASMIAGAAMQVIGRAYEAKAQAEMSEMSTGLANFKQRFGMFPPSKLTLPPTDAQSKLFIQTCWPRANPNGGWSVSGTLTGDQVLVWALGGYQIGGSGSGACLGFSDDPVNPGKQPTPGHAIGPFYEFQSDRLMSIRGGSGMSYIDPFGNNVPYLYFASAPTGNQYSNGDCPPVTNNLGGTSSANPYLDFPSPPHYINAASFQIICAGKDGMFGPGGLWQAANADSTPGYQSGQQGNDDLANFYPKRLGFSSN